MLKRLIAAFAAAVIVISLFSGCREIETNKYTSRPEDTMLFFDKAGTAYLTGTSSASFTEGGKNCGTINSNVVPLASGSMYYIEDGVMIYKSYLEPAYTVTKDAGIVFYALGSVFFTSADGDKLYSLENDTKYNKLIEGIGENGGNPTVFESGSAIYVITEKMLYRMIYGSNPEKILELDTEAVFLTDDDKGIYFAANGCIYYLKHNGVSAKKLISDAAPLPVTDRYFGSNCIFYIKDSKLCVLNTKNNSKTITDTELNSPEGILLPASAGKIEAIVVRDGEKTYLYEVDNDKVTEIADHDWKYYSEGFLYGFDGDKTVVLDIANDMGTTGDEKLLLNTLATPSGYYFTAGEEDGYNATLYAFSNGDVQVISQNVYGASAPRAIYQYGGVSYINTTGIYMFDEKSGESDLFAETTEIIDFIPRSGGAFALYTNGDIDLMVYGEEVSENITGDVSFIYEVNYNPFLLRAH